ncbi:MAG: hypothetical protein FJX76_20455 [Armatimonadetes bacterium]|nr:hypothetical protein [Armatimonadota bacterium]
MDAIKPAGVQTPAPAPATPSAPAEAPATVQDKVEVGKNDNEPSVAFRLARGAAGFVAGAATAVGAASLGAVRHAGDQSVELPAAAKSTLRIAGAGLGLIKGVTMGLAFGPLGVVIGAVAGPVLGAWTGGALAGGVEAVIDAGEGAFEGAKKGFTAGNDWARGLVDSMAGHPRKEPEKPGDSPPQRQP